MGQAHAYDNVYTSSLQHLRGYCIGREADRRMAKRISAKRGDAYSSVVSFLRRRFRFDLLTTCIIALRGYKKP